jgi:hypothetical protein
VLTLLLGTLLLCSCSAPVVGFKAVPSGDVGTNAWSTKAQQKAEKVEQLKAKGVDEAEAKALASGRYTFYQVCSTVCVGKGGKHDFLLGRTCILRQTHCSRCLDGSGLLPHSFT